LIFLCGINIFGQKSLIDSLKAEYDQLYGQDMLLYNGRKYFSDIYPMQGHPFWGGTDYFRGDIYLKGKVFRNNLLKYNLITQEFILSYSNKQEQHHPIVLTNSLIDSIRTTDVLFIKNHYSEIPQPFIQEIYEGKISCFAGRQKEVYEKIKDVKVRQAITDENKTYYLVAFSKVRKFHNSATFLKNFPKKKPIKKYISTNKLKFKGIKDIELKRLIRYCETVID
jgi:hypothetical protein